MGKFCWGLLVLLAVAFVGFGAWTEWKHNKTAVEYIKDKSDKQEIVVEDTETDEDVVVENEDGTAQATASIKF